MTIDSKVKIDELLANRWSPRVFDPSRQVTEEQIISICEAARWAPSCSNQQPYKYIVWNRKYNSKDFEKAFGTLDEGNQNWVKNCPVLVLAVVELNFNNGEINNWAEYDTGAASENICLQATSLGLHAHQMAGFDTDKIKTIFNIPTGFKPIVMIALGYKSNDLTLVAEKYRKMELSERKRKPINENFFDSKWENDLINIRD